MRNLTHESRDREDYNEKEEDNSHNGDRFEPSLDQLRDIFEGLRKIQKGRTF
jgi:hypothetical protein